MGPYHVRFMKTLCDSYGHPHECLQQDIHVRQAKSVSRALAAAKLRFQRLRKIADWQAHADYVDVEPGPGQARPDRRRRPRAG